MRQNLPRLWLDHHVCADSKVRRVWVELDAFEFEITAVFKPGNFIFKPLCFYDLLMQADVGVNHRLASLLKPTI